MSVTNTVLTTVPANIYASTGNSVVVTAYFCNTTGSSHSFNLYLIPSGGTAGTTNQIYNTVTLAAKDTHIINTERLVLANGDMLQANADANSSITVTVSYAGA